MIESHLYVQTFNALPDVIDADHRLDQLGRVAILDSLCQIIVKHAMQDRFGIRLLHTHHPVRAGEVMVEQAETLPGIGDALTTRAVAVARCGSRAEPNIWALRDGAWIAIEYSADPLVVAGEAPHRHPAFAAEIAQALVAAGVDDILGLCASRRDFFDRHGDGSGGRGLRLLETTDAARRANILRFADLATHPAERLIQTVWLASSGDEADCPVGGFHCTILVVCGEDNSGGHVRKIDHDREPLPSH